MTISSAPDLESESLESLGDMFDCALPSKYEATIDYGDIAFAMSRRGPRGLILARSPREAEKKAEVLGRAECVDQGVLKGNGKSARMAFGGVRKVISCAANPMAKDGVLTSQVPLLYSGVEATFSRFLVRGRKNLRSLIAGRRTRIDYEE